MKELSLNILDIAQNSVRAEAENITIAIEQRLERDLLLIEIGDDGCGMSEELLRRVSDPFSTTRTTRNVGMGIPLFKLAAEQSGGRLDISSRLSEGTTLRAYFALSSIDRPPLGDMGSTMALLISASPDIRFLYTHTTDTGSFSLDTLEMKAVLGDIPLNSPEVFSWIVDHVNSGLSEIGLV
jgi:hypothetical protein